MRDKGSNKVFWQQKSSTHSWHAFYRPQNVAWYWIIGAHWCYKMGSEGITNVLWQKHLQLTPTIHSIVWETYGKLWNIFSHHCPCVHVAFLLLQLKGKAPDKVLGNPFCVKLVNSEVSFSPFCAVWFVRNDNSWPSGKDSSLSRGWIFGSAASSFEADSNVWAATSWIASSKVESWPPEALDCSFISSSSSQSSSKSSKPSASASCASAFAKVSWAAEFLQQYQPNLKSLNNIKE